MFVSTFCALTTAPAMAAPEGSVMRPTNWPCSTWAPAQGENEVRAIEVSSIAAIAANDLSFIYIFLCAKQPEKGQSRSADKGSTKNYFLSMAKILVQSIRLKLPGKN